MKSIIIPVIAFEDTSVEEAVEFLRVRIIELDPDSTVEHTKRGISFSIGRREGEPYDAAGEEEARDGEVGVMRTAGPPEARRIIALEERGISAWDALNRIAREANLVVEVTATGITLRPQ